jgi:hypothetical protein
LSLIEEKKKNDGILFESGYNLDIKNPTVDIPIRYSELNVSILATERTKIQILSSSK